MTNTINLVPTKSKEAIKKAQKKFRYDIYTAIVVLSIVGVGVILFVVNTFYNIRVASSESAKKEGYNALTKFKPLIDKYETVDVKASQIKILREEGLSPVVAYTYLKNGAPSDFVFSNYALDTNNRFSATVTATNYINIAGFLNKLGSNSLEQITNTNLTSIVFQHAANTITFVITGTYEPKS